MSVFLGDRSGLVSPPPANSSPPPAESLQRVDLRLDKTIRAGTHAHDTDADSDWHIHGEHQLLYASRGTARLVSSGAQFFLPPQQAAWIPAGLPHRTLLAGVHSTAVFFAADMVTATPHRIHVLPAAPVLREMILHSRRWSIDRPATDSAADSFFTSIALLCMELMNADVPLVLPTTNDDALQRVIQMTLDDLANASIADICRAVGYSERTLRRHFLADLGITWQTYRLHARLLRAMLMLAEGHSVITSATTVGFDSVSAFTRAFTLFAGETPKAYRRRVRSASANHNHDGAHS